MHRTSMIFSLLSSTTVRMASRVGVGQAVSLCFVFCCVQFLLLYVKIPNEHGKRVDGR